jgi:hypothetical protein
MNTITTSLSVAGCVFVGSLVGLMLHRFLPKSHLTKDTHEVVLLGTTMLSVLASLVLGLLIATAKSAYDATETALRNHAYATTTAARPAKLREPAINCVLTPRRRSHLYCFPVPARAVSRAYHLKFNLSIFVRLYGT